MTIATANPIAWIDALGGSTESFEITSHVAVGRDDMDGWTASLTHLRKPDVEIRRHIPRENGHLLMLGMSPCTTQNLLDRGHRVAWHSTLKVGEGRYVRGCGYCTDFPTAFAEVNAYRHESRVIGPLTWWLESPDKWVSWIGATRLEAVRFTGEQNLWNFSAHGEAPTLEEAALLVSIHG